MDDSACKLAGRPWCGEMTNRGRIVTLRQVDPFSPPFQLYCMEPTSAGNDLVLVVDDEPHIVALVAYHLTKSGYRVATATAGADALVQARRDKPGLVVLDLML